MMLTNIFNIIGGPKKEQLANFDPSFYSIYYPDLASLKSERTLRRHYVIFGVNEGRLKNQEEAMNFYEAKFGVALPEDFDLAAYRSFNKDLASQFTQDWQFKLHYIQYGRRERRKFKLDGATRYVHSYELLAPDGSVPARRPTDETDFALEIPFRFEAQVSQSRPIAAFVHCFYPDVLPLILQRLENIPGGVDLYLSTNVEEKKAEVEELTASWRKGRVEIRIFPNRGRDIAPKFVGFKDVYSRHDLFVHLHTKKSPHAGDILSGWRDYLLDNLLGSPEIVRSNLSLFDDPKIGVVFPQHFFNVRSMLNWGFDYDMARALVAPMGVSLNKNLTLEFPSGSMFWGRTDALNPLLESKLQFSDFPEETGQIDGTIAHAIERSLLMIVESRGYEWLKVVQRDLYPLAQTILSVAGPDDIAKHRSRVFQPCLSRADAISCTERLGMPETKPLLSYPSRNERPRINILVPSVNPAEIYGGISTALKLFDLISAALGESFDRRIIVTDSRISPEAYEIHSAYSPVPFFQSLDAEPMQIVDGTDRAVGRLNLRAGDIFLATAWWTARHAVEFGRDQKRYFRKKPAFIYFIQDDEPYFYGWSSKWALAESTYHLPGETIAVINSEELYSDMTKRYRFKSVFCYPYKMNANISNALKNHPRERIILVYARPHATRNAFELICESLQEWQQREPMRARHWRIICLGQQFDEEMTYPVQNVSVVGKVSLEEYADYLSRASVGVSLMLSPHPSYPPLEMAEAGVTTITNRYGGKDLRQRFPEIISLDYLEPMSLADAIETAVGQAERNIGRIVPRRTPKQPFWRKPPPLDVGRIASAVRAELGDGRGRKTLLFW
ncbi:hypothetical protein MJC1_02968 [Methylocystis sp. MJC1]|nr:hypothetical protein MJC1_02968 [Methylocystis sp. MJC1]